MIVESPFHHADTAANNHHTKEIRMADPLVSFSDIHLNLSVRGLLPSATVAINDRSNELTRHGSRVFKLGLGQSPFPVPACVVASLRQHAEEKDYLPVQGLRALRDAVAANHRATLGIDCTHDEVLVGPGSKMLMFLLQLTYYGDLVIPSPAWVSYAPQARIIGRQIHLLPTKPENDWQPAPEQLDRLCRQDPGRPRILVLNYPSNPTGRTMSRDHLKELAEVARRNHVVILSDEIYGGIHHEGGHVSIAPFYPEGTIISGGLSKWCGAGGWRLGVFVFPQRMRWLLDAMASAGTETYTSTSAPIQFAAITAFQGGPEIDEYLVHSRRVLKALGNLLFDCLKAAGADVLPPQGGFYLFPDFTRLKDRFVRNGINTSAEMCQRLLEATGVAILPGSDFERPEEELTARLAYVNFDGAAAPAASEAIPLEQDLGDDFAMTHCTPSVKAVDLMCDWVESLG